MLKGILKKFIILMIGVSLFALSVCAAEENPVAQEVSVPVTVVYKEAEITVRAIGRFSTDPEKTSYLIRDGETADVILGSFPEPNDYIFEISDGETAYTLTVRVTYDELSEKTVPDIWVTAPDQSKTDEIVFRGETTTETSSEPESTVPTVITGDERSYKPYIFLAVGCFLLMMLLAILIAKSKRNADS